MKKTNKKQYIEIECYNWKYFFLALIFLTSAIKDLYVMAVSESYFLIIFSFIIFLIQLGISFALSGLFFNEKITKKLEVKVG